MKVLCDVMEVSRAGYYKWLNRKPTERDVRREEAAGLVMHWATIYPIITSKNTGMENLR